MDACLRVRDPCVSRAWVRSTAVERSFDFTVLCPCSLFLVRDAASGPCDGVCCRAACAAVRLALTPLRSSPPALCLSTRPHVTHTARPSDSDGSSRPLRSSGRRWPVRHVYASCDAPASALPSTAQPIAHVLARAQMCVHNVNASPCPSLTHCLAFTCACGPFAHV